MTGTWEEMFQNSLFRSGVLGRGEIVDADQLDEAKTTTKLVLDELDGDGLSLPVYTFNIQFNTVAGQQKYGLGGPFEGGTSSDSITIGTGLKTFTLDTIVGFFGEGQTVTILEDADDPTNSMTGKVVSISGATLVVSVTSITGDGTFTTWFITINSLRPETILTGMLQLLGGSNPVYQDLSPMSGKSFRNLITPKTGSQPFEYYLNPGYPIADFYLFPTPTQIWPILLTCKVKWTDVVTNPMLDPFSVAQLPSGYYNGITNIVALRLAENNRLETDTLKNKASQAKYFMTSQVWGDLPDLNCETPDAFPWNIIRAGMNP